MLGRRTSFKDPDSKPYSFAYNGLGELVLITDGQQRTTRFTLDALGRAYRVEAPEGTATNTWDTAANGKGKLASSNSSTGIGRSLRVRHAGQADQDLAVGPRAVVPEQQRHV